MNRRELLTRERGSLEVKSFFRKKSYSGPSKAPDGLKTKPRRAFARVTPIVAQDTLAEFCKSRRTVFRGSVRTRYTLRIPKSPKL